MNRFTEILNSSTGKVRIAAIVLGLVITAALTAWTIILYGHYMHGNISPEMLFEEEEAGEDSIDGMYVSLDDGTPYGPPVPPNVYVKYEVQPDTIEKPLSDAYPDIFYELDSIAARYNSVSAALAVYDGDTGEFYTYSYGYANRDAGLKADNETKFLVAGLSKQVTAICVMTLVDGGLIGLDNDVSNYFGYEVVNPNFPDMPITARMLLNHTSSVFDSGEFEESRDNGSSESVKMLIEDGSSFRRNNPGTRYEYSDFGYAILGALCEKVSGKPLDAMAREVIFKPLDIDAAFVPGLLQDTRNIAVIYDSEQAVSRSVAQQLSVQQSVFLGDDLHLAHSNLTISAVDYAKIMAMLGSKGTIADKRILSEASVNEMQRADVEGPGYMQGLSVRYSDGGFIEGESFYWHPGSLSGIFSQYIYSTNPNRGVVVVTSGAAASYLESGMIDVCRELSLSAWKMFYRNTD